MMFQRFILALAVLWTAGAAAPLPTQAQSLKSAYKREFAFLEAERAALKERLTAVEQDSQARLDTARAEIDKLQGAILRAAVESDRLDQLLAQTESAAAEVAERTDVLEQTLERAGTSLERYSLELPDVELEEGAGTDAVEQAFATALQSAFDQGLEQLQTLGTIRKEQGAFFDARGTRVEGEIIRVGDVASYGVSKDLAGALAPAGANRLKLWLPGQSGATAQALAGGSPPSTLGIFLYESIDKGVSEKKDKTPREVVESGGVIAWVIVGLGCLSLLMMLLRGGMLARSAANTEKIIERIAPMLEKGNIQEAQEICRKSRSAAGRVLRSTLSNLNADREHLEDIVSESILHETPHLDRFGSSILVLAAVAPLMGLLGTVTGMISTFDVITEFGTGNPKLLSGGISEALVTTELGLIVAIPSLLGGNLLGGWATRIKDDMDRGALRVTNIARGIEVRRLSQRPPATSPAEAEALGAS